MGKKNLQNLEELNLSLRMENIELRRMLEMVEEEKRNMRFQLHHVLKEQVTKSSTLLIAKDTSRRKPIRGHGLKSGYGPYGEDDACAF